MKDYDPFSPGPSDVAVVSLEVRDATRSRVFPVEVWVPRGTDHPLPLAAYSHHSGGSRRSASYLCLHLASHGWAVAALDHSEVVAREFVRPENGETETQRTARISGIIANRVPDLRFLIESVLAAKALEVAFDPGRVAVVGHSFGGWTALAVPEVEPLVRAVVAHAPGGAANPRPGVVRVPLTFSWGRSIPTLFLAAEFDTPIPVEDVAEVYDRAPAPKLMVVLRRADHQHFADDVAESHEALRASNVAGEAAWLPAAMRPITDLCSQDEAHTFARGLTLAHLDAHLRGNDHAAALLAGDLESRLAVRAVDAYVWGRPPMASRL